MATFSHILLFLSSLSLLTSSIATTSFRPRALVLPVTKDSSTSQYITHLSQRTPLVPIKLTLDLGGQSLWVDCDQGYLSSSYKPAHCRSAQCALAGSKSCGDCFDGPKPGCNNNTCGTFPDNTISGVATIGEIAQDIVSIQSTNGFNPGKVVSVPKFTFSCGSTSLLEGLANGVKGMAGLGRTKIALPSQFSSAFSFHKKFAICLSSAPSWNGVVFFGDFPYFFHPRMVILKSNLLYTPLIKNPVSTASASSSV